MTCCTQISSFLNLSQARARHWATWLFFFVRPILIERLEWAQQPAFPDLSPELAARPRLTAALTFLATSSQSRAVGRWLVGLEPRRGRAGAPRGRPRTPGLRLEARAPPTSARRRSFPSAPPPVPLSINLGPPLFCATGASFRIPPSPETHRLVLLPPTRPRRPLTARDGGVRRAVPVAPHKPFATEAGKQSQYLHHPGQHFNVQSNDQGTQCPVAARRNALRQAVHCSNAVR